MTKKEIIEKIENIKKDKMFQISYLVIRDMDKYNKVKDETNYVSYKLKKKSDLIKILETFKYCLNVV